jgi:hypothetical protein
MVELNEGESIPALVYGGATAHTDITGKPSTRSGVAVVDTPRNHRNWICNAFFCERLKKLHIALKNANNFNCYINNKDSYNKNLHLTDCCK